MHKNIINNIDMRGNDQFVFVQCDSNVVYRALGFESNDKWLNMNTPGLYFMSNIYNHNYINVDIIPNLSVLKAVTLNSDSGVCITMKGIKQLG